MTAVRLEVGIDYESIGPAAAPTRITVESIDEEAGGYRISSKARLPAPFIAFGAERFWRRAADPVLDLADTAPWWTRRLAGFDLETTGPLPEDARIVTASIAEVGAGEPTVNHDWLADPGVEIPEGASAVHGITTERARADGRPACEVIAEVVEELARLAALGVPIVIFNARYDLTVLDRECRRHGIVPLTARGVTLLVIDPMVVDKQLDRFRKGSRKLDAVCAAYGARLDQAHAADADALAATRCAWVLGAKGVVKRQIRNYRGHAAGDRRELAALTAEWEACRYDLRLLHAAQVRWALAERDRFAEYKASVGEHEAAVRIRAEVGWPILDVMVHEEWAVADAA